MKHFKGIFGRNQIGYIAVGCTLATIIMAVNALFFPDSAGENFTPQNLLLMILGVTVGYLLFTIIFTKLKAPIWFRKRAVFYTSFLCVIGYSVRMAFVIIVHIDKGFNCMCLIVQPVAWGVVVYCFIRVAKRYKEKEVQLNNRLDAYRRE
ncbi:MAG: hypothetical protein FWC95_01425 [Defluviitaleaceae bacterium]|nr:hypothetical protein [Defluviitaleaceae bacterium]